MYLTTLNMADAYSEDKAVQAKFCHTLLDCLSTQGFVKIVNHGMEKTVTKAFEWNDTFFHLPESKKEEIAHPPKANPNRGWSAIGQEKSSAITDFEKGETVVKQVFDVKEAFDMGSPEDPLYANKWPSEESVPGFRTFMEGFYGDCHKVHNGILRSLEQALKERGLEVDLVEMCTPNVSELRLNYYPKMELKDMRTGKMSRISEHTDFGTVTLLFQDSIGGLEIENQDVGKDGQYVPIEAEKGTEMLVNIGDSLQRLTNDYFTSVSHRVMAPVGVQDQPEGTINDRYSIAYFAKFKREQSLKPIDTFVDEEHPVKYDDMTAYELNQVKLQKIYG